MNNVKVYPVAEYIPMLTVESSSLPPSVVWRVYDTLTIPLLKVSSHPENYMEGKTFFKQKNCE